MSIETFINPASIASYFVALGLTVTAITAFLGIASYFKFIFRLFGYTKMWLNPPTPDATIIDQLLQQQGTQTIFGSLLNDMDGWADMDVSTDLLGNPIFHKLPAGWRVVTTDGLVKLGQLGVAKAPESTIDGSISVYDDRGSLRAVLYRLTRATTKMWSMKIVVDILVPLNNQQPEDSNT